jgi:arylsulfatase
VRETGQLTYEVRRDIDAEYNRRATRFLHDNAAAGTPFFLYFNHSLLHTPVVPRDEYKGKSGNGDWADSLVELDGDFGALLDQLDTLGLRDNTIEVFAGDNGNEDYSLLVSGTPGYWEGSMCTGLEGSLRTPCLVRWPGHVSAGRHSNEIMHVTDWFTTLLTMAGLPVPGDREIDGKDQSAFLGGEQEQPNRDGFIYWNGPRMYGVKWQNFKATVIDQRSMLGPALELTLPRITNLLTDPKEREPVDKRYAHTWTIAHFARILQEFQESVKREPLIPAGAPLDHVPTKTTASSTDQFNIPRGGLAD